MTNLPEQFSEARKLQLEAQFNFFQTFTGKAFESVEKLVALNFDVSRQSLEKSSALMRQMMAAKDPRDLLAVTKQTQSQFDSAMAYSRQLFGIVSAAAPVAAPVAAPAAIATEPEAPAAAAPALAPEAVAAVPAAAPIAEPTPIAKAAGTPELPKPAAASFPVTSSSKPIEVTQVKPVDAEPPPAPVSGTPEIVAKQAAAPAGKASRKK
jgi:phasin family protein